MAIYMFMAMLIIYHKISYGKQNYILTNQILDFNKEQKQIFENLPDGALIHSHQDGSQNIQIEWINKTFLNMFSHIPSQLNYFEYQKEAENRELPND